MMISDEADVVELPFVQITDFDPADSAIDHSSYSLADTSADFAWPVPSLDYFAGLAQNAQYPANAKLREDSSSQIQRTSIEDFTRHPVPSLSLIPLTSNNIGSEHYHELRERAYMVCDEMPILKKTNSLFSDHIDALETCLSTQASCGPVIPDKQCVLDCSLQHCSYTDHVSRLLGAIEFMMRAFINVSWTQMDGWETYTKTITAVKDLTNWRMNRSWENCDKIVVQYRPTRLQMSIEHPSVM